jgi:hypothetical protein
MQFRRDDQPAAWRMASRRDPKPTRLTESNPGMFSGSLQKNSSKWLGLLQWKEAGRSALADESNAAGTCNWPLNPSARGPNLLVLRNLWPTLLLAGI